MPEIVATAGAIVAGCMCAGALIAAGDSLSVARLQRAVKSHQASLSHLFEAKMWYQRSIERAGWSRSGARVAACWFVLAGCAVGFAATIGLALAPMGLLGVGALFLFALNSAVEKRRRRLAGELVPLLELFTLELSGGGSALSALGSVSVQVQSELAADLRRMLIASQVAGTASFEVRLTEYAERTGIASLSSLATVLGASREFGTGASQGVRALATDLRRAQRRELIAHSRRALNHVLMPAAVTVLLPFLCILMFPAVSVLQHSLR